MILILNKLYHDSLFHLHSNNKANLESLPPHVPTYLRAAVGPPTSTSPRNFCTVCGFSANYTCVRPMSLRLFHFGHTHGCRRPDTSCLIGDTKRGSSNIVEKKTRTKQSERGYGNNKIRMMIFKVKLKEAMEMAFWELGRCHGIHEAHDDILMLFCVLLGWYIVILFEDQQ